MHGTYVSHLTLVLSLVLIVLLWFCRIAGTDTSSTSISYFLWELTRRPDILRKLQQEIDEVMPDPNVVPDIKVLNSLEYLGAFLKEGV